MSLLASLASFDSIMPPEQDARFKRVQVVPGRKGQGVTFSIGDGFYFVKNSTRGETAYLKCSECPVRAVMLGDSMRPSDPSQRHSHPPDVTLGKVQDFKEALKTDASGSVGSLKQVFRQTSEQFDEGVQSEVAHNTVKSAMYKARRRACPDMPQDFDSLHDVLVGQSAFARQYCRFSEEDFMCRGKCGPHGHQYVVPTSTAMLNVLVSALWIFLDGTFSARPDTSDSRQLFVMSAVRDSYLFPCCFALMESKSTQACRSLFQFLKGLAPDLSPSRIVTDVEVALVSPIRDIFPTARHQGCWFHYTQALYRMARHLGLVTYLESCGRALMILRMCYVLPLLPAASMIEGFNAIMYTCNLNGLERMEGFLNYVKATWLEKVGPELLSVHRSKHRTNNYVESYHKALMDRIKVRRPGVFSFIKWIFSELKNSGIDVCRLQNGLPMQRPRKKRWIRQDANIRKWLGELRPDGPLSVLEFLMKAQNIVKGLQRHHFYAGDEEVHDESYPAVLPYVEDDDRDSPDDPPSESQEPQQAGPVAEEPQASQDLPDQLSQPLLLPAARVDFANGVPDLPIQLHQEPELSVAEEAVEPGKYPYGVEWVAYQSGDFVFILYVISINISYPTLPRL